ACSSSVEARPSQNWSVLYARLMTVGALRPPRCPPIPSELAAPSPKALAGSWQLAQATEPSDESRLSKKSSLPSSALAGVKGLSSGQKIGGRPSGAWGVSSSAPPRVHEKTVGASKAPTKVANRNLRFIGPPSGGYPGLTS